MKNVIATNSVCLTRCEGKTLKKVVFGYQDEEALFIFTDGTFARLRAESMEDDATLENVSHIHNSDVLLRLYPVEVLREFIASEILEQWLRTQAATEADEKLRNERYEKELYARLKAKFEGNQ